MKLNTETGITRRSTLLSGAAAAALIAATTSAALAGTATAEDPATGCSIVAHVGDSTSVGMTDPAILPDEADRMVEQYKAVAGVQEVRDDSVVGRGVLEPGQGTTSGEAALQAAEAVSPAPDCYVVALGTNDAANINGGSTATAADRIAKVLAVTGDKPVIWPTVKVSEATGFASAAAEFNTALSTAAVEHPTLKVLDWASTAPEDMLASDGMHYTADGTKARVTAIAEALAQLRESSPASDPAATPAPSNSDDGEDTTLPGTTYYNW